MKLIIQLNGKEKKEVKKYRSIILKAGEIALHFLDKREKSHDNLLSLWRVNLHRRRLYLITKLLLAHGGKDYGRNSAEEEGKKSCN